MRAKSSEATPGVPVGVFQQMQVENALEFAGLTRDAFQRGPHFDNGHLCTYLKADIQEYSAFIAALAVQCRLVDVMVPLVDRVQLQYDGNGDTRFWMPGFAIL